MGKLIRYRDPAGMDGIKRDLAKLCNAWIARKNAPEIIFAKKRRWSFHNETNIWVETCRDANYVGASYLAGHFLMVSLCTNVVLAAALIGVIVSWNAF